MDESETENEADRRKTERFDVPGLVGAADLKLCSSEHCQYGGIIFSGE